LPLETTPIITAPTPTPTFNIDVQPIPISSLKGKLLYKFKETNIVLRNLNNNGNANPTPSNNNLYVDANPVMTILGSKPPAPKNQYPVSTTNAKPLAGVSVSLVVTYLFKGKSKEPGSSEKDYDFSPITTSQSGYLNDDQKKSYEQVLATTITGADGSFNFNSFINPHEDYGLVQADIDKGTSGEFSSHLKGDMYKVLRLKVNDQYYLSPDLNITINPWEAKDIGEVVSLVKSYNLKVTTKWKEGVVEDIFGGEGLKLNKVKLNLLRTSLPNHIPEEEGGEKNINLTSNFIVVAMGETSDDGSVIYRNLVQHNPNSNSDRYKMYTVSNESANVTYKPKDSYYNHYSKSEFPFNSSYYVPSTGNYISTTYLGSNITWNHELEVKTYEETLELYPNKPSILGEFIPISGEDANKKLSGETVILVKSVNTTSQNIPFITVTKTNSLGKYKFVNLPVAPAKNKQKDKNPERILSTYPKGFKTEPKDIEKMQMGSQIVHDFALEPDGYISGNVQDDEGKPVKAIVNVDDLTIYETKTSNSVKPGNYKPSSGGYTYTVNQITEKFSFKAPSGTTRKLVVKAQGPMASEYAVLDTIITIKKGDINKNEPLKIVLVKKRKRIKFQVVEYKPSRIRTLNGVPIAGAKVTLEQVPSVTESKLTDAQGFVSFAFDNNANDFTFLIEPPKGKESDYSTESFQVNNVENTTAFKISFKSAYLKKTAKISGIVTIEGSPLEGAKVYFDKGGVSIETKQLTNSKGEYTLNGIAQDIGEIELWASKTGVTPNIKTQKQVVTISEENTVNFNLEYDKEVSITSIFGFDVDIKNKEKQSDGTYLIKEANLINIPKNDNFKITDENFLLGFKDVIIKKVESNKTDSYGTPIFEPAQSKIDLNDKTLDIKINDAFYATFGDGSKQLVLQETNNKGEIKNKISINNGSFTPSSNLFALEKDNDIHLTTEEGSTDMAVKVIAIENPVKEKFGIVNTKGEPLTYKVGGFNASAKQATSHLKGNEIVLNTKLTTNKIKGLTPEKLELEAGNLVITPLEIKPLGNNSTLNFKLEKWNFESQNWVFNYTSGIEIANGTIKTGKIDVPVKNITITTNTLDIDNFDINGLKIGGVTNLEVNPASQTLFHLKENSGSDNGSHWEFLIAGSSNSVASFSLPGFEANKKFNLNLVSILSNGEEEIMLNNSNNYEKLYNIIDVKPSSISIGNNYLDILTSTDLGIPRVPTSTGFIRYRMDGGQIKTEVSTIPFTIDAPGKVTYKVGNKPEDSEIRKDFFKAIGTIKDAEGINLIGSIQKTPTSLHIEVEPNQKLQLGGSNTSFASVEGRIDIDKTTNDWKKFVFSGELEGFTGVKKGKRQTFTVHGAITASDESIDVNNINTPFGNLAITYDIKNSRFLGDININQPIGGMQYVGSANLLMGSQGWYFTSGGIATTPGIGAISVGLIIGDSDYLPTDVSNTLMQYAYDKHVPPTIKNGVSGLFITGRKDVPISIPDWKINLGVVSAAMGANAGLDARVWMNFNQSGNIYGIGAMAFAHVYFKASSITCTHFSASAKAELGVKGDYNTATKAFSIDGCGSITVGGRFEQCFPIPFAGCEGCIGTSISKGVRLDLHLDSNGNTDMAFGFGGNCSGATSGW
jgi:hypothetical protein